MPLRAFAHSFSATGGREAFPADSAWFALRAPSRQEFIAANAISRACIPVFLPSYTHLSQWSRDRRKAITRPLFPGYLFARFDPIRDRDRVLAASGVCAIVGAGDRSWAIDAETIENLQRAVRDPRAVAPWTAPRDWRAGERVTIARGALAGLSGTIERAGGARRLIVTVGLLNRACAVELTAADVYYGAQVLRACG